MLKFSDILRTKFIFQSFIPQNYLLTDVISKFLYTFISCQIFEREKFECLSEFLKTSLKSNPRNFLR